MFGKTQKRIVDYEAHARALYNDVEETRQKVAAIAKYLGVRFVGPYGPTYTPAEYFAVKVDEGTPKKK